MSQKFYICSHCGNIIAFCKKIKGVPIICCGEKNEKKIIPGTTDASVEKTRSCDFSRRKYCYCFCRLC